MVKVHNTSKTETDIKENIVKANSMEKETTIGTTEQHMKDNSKMVKETVKGYGNHQGLLQMFMKDNT